MRLRVLGWPAQAILRYQYRMNSELSRFLINYAYVGELEDAPEIKDTNSKLNLAVKEQLSHFYPNTKRQGMIFFTCTSARHETEANGTSLLNQGHANYTATIIKQLLRHDAIDITDIGYLTYCKAQLGHFKKRASKHHISVDRRNGIDMKTVNSSQGSERLIVLLDFVVSCNDKGEVEVLSSFIRNFNRLIVALSRAKDALIIIGNHHLLEQVQKFGSEMEWVKRYGKGPLTALYDHIKEHKIIEVPQFTSDVKDTKASRGSDKQSSKSSA
ncbi:MAG: hypothetical protein M1835_004958 [Candelina submexicana]|nr:MAG: hypothetical protein M1835_004958 [Candelina submexicana]